MSVAWGEIAVNGRLVARRFDTFTEAVADAYSRANAAERRMRVVHLDVGWVALDPAEYSLLKWLWMGHAADGAGS